MRGMRPSRRWLSVLVVVPALAVATSSTPVLADTNVGDVGAGYLSGTVNFDAGMGVPQPPNFCGNTSWHYSTLASGSTAGIVIDVLPGDYEGLITIGANGTSTGCASAALETGTLGVSVSAANPNVDGLVPDSLQCSLGGEYFRVANAVLIVVGGNPNAIAGTGCDIGGTWDPVTFISTGSFVPTSSPTAPTI